MTSDEPTRAVVKWFRKAGWTPGRTVGSHTMWKCSCGRHQFPLPDGHRTISPGVVRKAQKALKECEEKR